MDEQSLPTCHHCLHYCPGPGQCGLHRVKVNAGIHFCRDHSQNCFDHLAAGKLYRLEETLLGTEILVDRSIRRSGGKGNLVCSRCRKKLEKLVNSGAATADVEQACQALLTAPANGLETLAAAGILDGLDYPVEALENLPELCGRCRDELARGLESTGPLASLLRQRLAGWFGE